MIDRVLVPMDESELAEKALRYALEAHPDAEVMVLHVVGNPSPMMGGAASMALEDDVQEAAKEQAEELFDRALEIAAEYDADITTHATIGHPAKLIVEIAEEFDTVVIGSHSSSLVHRLIVGNIAETVVSESPVPVTVVK